MKPLRLTLFLATLALLLGAYILVWEREDDSARSSRDAARAAFRFSPAEITSITLRQAASLISCERTPAGWRLVAPIAARADADAVERLLQALHDLPLANLVIPPRTDPAAYAPYGLAPPRAIIELSDSPSAPPRRFLLGSRTPLGDGVYARTDAHPAIVRIPDTLPDLLPSTPDALRDRVLVRGDPAAIVRLDLRSPSGYLQLARDPSENWRLWQPFPARADPAAVTAVLDALLSCSIVQFVQDNAQDLAPYGLDAQTALTAVLNPSDGSGPQVLSVGDPLPNAPSLVYARLQADNSVYAVPASLRDALLLRPDDLRDPRIPGLSDPAAIQRFRLEAPPAALEAHRDPDGLWQLDAPFAAPADNAAVEDLLRAWSEIRLVSYPSPNAPTPSDFPRTLRLTLRDAPSTPLVLQIAPSTPDIPAPSNAIWLAIADDATLAHAAPAAPLSAPLDPAPLLTRELLSVPESDIATILFTPAPGAEPVRYARDPDGTWTPDTPALRNALALLSPLRAASYLPADTPPPDSPATLEIHLRGATGIALSLSFSPSSATLRGHPLPFLLPPAALATFSSLSANDH